MDNQSPPPRDRWRSAAEGFGGSGRMIEAEVSLYLASRERLARLQKVIAFPVLPRVSEFVKVRNREQGDYFAFTVVQVTHREGGPPELWLQLTSFVGSRSVVDFFEDSELDEYVAGYKQEGWSVGSVTPNRTFRGDGSSVWSELAGSAPDAEPGAAADGGGR